MAPFLGRRQRKRNSEPGHDERDQRVGELLVQLYPEPHYIEAALLQIADVAAQFLVVHLGVLFHFLLEI